MHVRRMVKSGPMRSDLPPFACVARGCWHAHDDDEDYDDDIEAGGEWERKEKVDDKCEG